MGCFGHYKWAALLGIAVILTISCSAERRTYVTYRSVSKQQGDTLSLGEMSFVIPAGAIRSDCELSLAVSNRPTSPVSPDDRLVGPVLTIGPHTLVLRSPATLAVPYHGRASTRSREGDTIHLAYFNGSGWVRIKPVSGEGDPETVHFKLYHGGEYALVAPRRPFGIIESRFLPGEVPLVLIHGLLGPSETWSDMVRYVQDRYDGPLWQFHYPPGEPLEQAADLLFQEMRRLHQIHGPFKVNLIGHGTGGLIALFFALDEELGKEYIDHIVITMGTPNHGTVMAVPDTILRWIDMYEAQGCIPPQYDPGILFGLIDGLGTAAPQVVPESSFFQQLSELHKVYRAQECIIDSVGPGFRIECFSGSQPHPRVAGVTSPWLLRIPALISGLGDTYVTIEDTKLTPIENAPFPVDHFALPHYMGCMEDVVGYLALEPFRWLDLFQDIGEEEGRVRIVDIWEKEFKLNQGDPHTFDVLLEFGRNLLQSVERDAILFTNGDNDTYPLWYLQQRENFRRDVAICNLSLLNTAFFARYLKGEPHHVPIPLSDAGIDSLKALKEPDSFITISEQLVDMIIREAGSRPLYFAVTVYSPSVRSPNRLEGLVYRVVSEGEGSDIDVEKCRVNLAENYNYDSVLDKNGCIAENLDPDIRQIVNNYGYLHFMLANEALEHSNRKDALQELKEAERFLPQNPRVKSTIARLFWDEGNVERAKWELEEAVRVNPDHFETYSTLCSLYVEIGRREDAVRLIAHWLELHPDDSEAVQLLQRYAGD
jgi:pimeloyl-ACP methyl ester carboxylesterase/tetratricopeptide (TPR) repeat protein